MNLSEENGLACIHKPSQNDIQLQEFIARPTHKEFFSRNIDLSKYKVSQLKSVIKNVNAELVRHRLLLSGTKSVIIQRLAQYFLHSKIVVNIQRIARGFLVKQFFRLKGPAFKNMAECVNGTDFFTLEPLIEIPHELFFSFKDKRGFVYGFNIQSFITLFKKNETITNPYNRERISDPVIIKMYALYTLIHSIFPDSLVDEADTYENVMVMLRNHIFSHILIPSTRRFGGNSITRTIETIDAVRTRLADMRASPFESRIRELMSDIDYLGNYTCTAWLFELDTRGWQRLYTALYEIWTYRAHINEDVKLSICPLGDPFVSTYFRQSNRFETRTQDMIYKDECLAVMEYIVYTGVDIEFRKLGALHVLTALTIVSSSARVNMYWLFESIV